MNEICNEMINVGFSSAPIIDQFRSIIKKYTPPKSASDRFKELLKDGVNLDEALKVAEEANSEKQK